MTTEELAFSLAPDDSPDNPAFPNHSDIDIWAAGFIAGFEQFDTSKVTRVEVIDRKGRAYTNWLINNKVEISLQDDKRTLKIFIKNDKGN